MQSVTYILSRGHTFWIESSRAADCMCALENKINSIDNTDAHTHAVLMTSTCVDACLFNLLQYYAHTRCAGSMRLSTAATDIHCRKAFFVQSRG